MKKDQFFSIVVDSETKDRLHALAQHDQRTLAGMIRALLADAIPRAEDRLGIAPKKPSSAKAALPLILGTALLLSPGPAQIRAVAAQALPVMPPPQELKVISDTRRRQKRPLQRTIRSTRTIRAKIMTERVA